ncbi:hypothetical protein [Dysgonomonas sp. 511]|uniref:hypothetical protein n=1 Tax=Dysgonomonas sp. 511 TaxID=2302930 RepID=UPI001C881DC3|nr:hypothetical protein [Dysgonomonas sp. 511]
MNILKSLFNNTSTNNKTQYWLFVALLVALSIFVMLCNGITSKYYAGYDFFFHLHRLEMVIQALREGTYPFYFDYEHVEGYGYFVNGFYPDFILVPFAIVGLFTDAFFAYDFMIFTMTVLCGLIMYHTVRVVYNNRYAAAISSILYTFSMYRLYDVYHRSALAEALSFTFLPLVFLGLYYIIHGDYKKWYVLALSYILLIYTHAISSVLTFITFLVFIAVYYKSFKNEPKRIYYLLLAAGVTFIAVCYYWLPILEQVSHAGYYFNKRLPGGGAGYGKVGFDYVLWGLLSGVAYYKTKLWTGVGIVLVSVIFLRFFIKGQKSDKLRLTDLGVIIGICYIIASARIIPWGSFPLNIISFIQYPWRLYEFSTYFLAIAGGYYLSLLLVKKKQRMLWLVLIVFITMGTIYIHSLNFKEMYPKRDKWDRVRNEFPSLCNNYNIIGGEYLPAKIPYLEHISHTGIIINAKDPSTSIKSLKRYENKTRVKVVVNKPDTIALPLFYYYGYQATLNGKPVEVSESDIGLVAVPVNESGEIEAWYATTAIRKLSFYVSISVIILLIIFAIYSQRKQNRKVDEYYPE